MKQRATRPPDAQDSGSAAAKSIPADARSIGARFTLPPDTWLAAIIESSADAIVGKTLDGIVMSWNPGAEHLFGYAAEEMIGNSISIIYAPGHENEMPMILDRIRHGIPVSHFDTVRRRKDGRLIDISLSVSPVRDASGRIIGASKIARDIGERKSWEAKQTLLLGELSHRVKNSLAVIQAIARQTGRNSGSIGDFLDKFDNRLAAMSAAHDLLVAGGWSGTSLAKLVDSVLRHDLDDHGGQIQVDLPDCHVDPSFALNLALALHELATNAAKFGALSIPSGRVALTGQVISSGQNSGGLMLIWAEDGGPQVLPPERRGFGTVLLEQLIARRHGGTVRLEWRPSGLLCTMMLRLDNTV